MKPVTKLVVAVLPVLLIVGCGSTEVKEESSDSGKVVSTSETSDKSTSGASDDIKLNEKGLVSEALPVAEPIDDQNAVDSDLLAERKIYFDFDLSEIKEEYQAILQAHASNLIANPNVSVVIEGHCDERGTREYNMALGERRAYSVLQFFTLQGVDKAQIRVVSFGEERPDVEGHDESAWKWNRRAVIVYAE